MHQAHQAHQISSFSAETYRISEYRTFCNNCRTFSISSVEQWSIEDRGTDMEPRFACDICGDRDLISEPRRIVRH
jgi:hypothetical protein